MVFRFVDFHIPFVLITTIKELERLNSALESQLERMETAWEAMMDDVQSDVHTALEKILNEMSHTYLQL